MKLLAALLLVPAVLAGQTPASELVNVKELIPDIVVDMRYTSVDNFLGEKMYSTDEPFAALSVVNRLIVVQDSLRKRGLGLKLYDGYRPRTVQYLMWEILPNPTYVADPAGGSNHNRGAAVDVSLVNLATGSELQMPTKFDFFGDAAWHGYMNLPPEAIANRELLKAMMENVGGFTSYAAEWWHYTYAPALANPLFDFQLK